MAESAFIKAFNPGNLAFQAAKGEIFIVDSDKRSIKAIEIAELTAQDIIKSGGKFAANTVMLDVFKSDMGDLKDGSKIIVRGKRLRVETITDSGDNKFTLMAGPAGVRI